MTDWTVPGTVVRVVDGDTLLVDLALGWHVTLRNYVRLARINAPEHGTPDGEAATAFVADLAGPGTEVQIVSHRLLGQTEVHGRVLASVTLPDERDLSDVVLKAGHAVEWKGRA